MTHPAHPHDGASPWPPLPYGEWRHTADTLLLWTQVVGKLKLALSPWLNHGWQVPLYVNARGLGTGPVPVGHELLEVDFDFVDHHLVMRHSSGATRGFALGPMPVAAFYRRFLHELAALGVQVTINPMPSEQPNPIPFDQDETHAAYDGAAVRRFWRVLVQADRVFKLFRTGFLGKASPVHFFWGAFDLAVTRFSGRRAPMHPGGLPGLPDPVLREAYSHEVSSAGFWPGSAAYPHAAFYSYAYPAPAGFAQAPVGPPGLAEWSEALGEWLLPYDKLRHAADPDATLLEFLRSSYRAAADLGHWDPALDCALGVPNRPRALHGAG